MTIRSKLIFAALVSAVLLILLAGLSYYGQHRANRASDFAHDKGVVPQLAISEIDSMMKDVRFHMAGFMIDIMSSNGARAKIKDVREKVPKNWKIFMGGFDANGATEDERTAVANIDKAMADLGPVLDAIDAAYAKEDKDGINEILTTKWPRIIKSLVRPLSETLVPSREAFINKTFEEMEAEGKKLVMIALIANLIGITILAVIMVPLVRSISKSIDDMRHVLVKVAGGDLSVHADTQRNDELGDMARSLAATMDSLRDLLNGTISSSDSVVKESEAMRCDAHDLAKTAEEQSMATSAIAAAVEELTVSIGVMSDSADAAGSLSVEAEKKTHDSINSVSAATENIQKVADGVSQASRTMEELSAKVGNINNIVQTIRDIADQTNLLALNAAIEAARAGEQGRGFAVVADEVRKLAERTTASTQEISEIVGGVRQTTDVAHSNMSHAKSLAEEGARHTEGIRSAMMGMDQSSSEVRKSIEAIAHALREQNAASTDIAQRVEMIAQGIERTHAASTESNRRSGVLVDLSLKLKDGVRRFRT